MVRMAIDVSAARAGVAQRYPKAAAMVSDLERVGRLVVGPVAWLIENRGDRFWERVEWLADLEARLEGSPAEALAEYTIMYLKEQMAFQKTGQYSNTDFDEVRKAVYDNPDVMQRFYLEGLMLTHAFWPIHFDIHEFFNREFVERVPDSGIGLEVGFGHGLYLLEVLTRKPGTRTKSFDISPYARTYAARVLEAGGVARHRYELTAADVREPLPAGDASQDWAIFAEVLEHIPDPLGALRDLARCLKPGAPLFATTVLHSNAIDHIYQFESAAEVRGMLSDTGFSVDRECILRVADYGANSTDRTVDLAYVCSRRAE